jgi:hypothetical protein
MVFIHCFDSGKNQRIHQIQICSFGKKVVGVAQSWGFRNFVFVFLEIFRILKLSSYLVKLVKSTSIFLLHFQIQLLRLQLAQVTQHFLNVQPLDYLYHQLRILLTSSSRLTLADSTTML